MNLEQKTSIFALERNKHGCTKLMSATSSRQVAAMGSRGGQGVEYGGNPWNLHMPS